MGKKKQFLSKKESVTYSLVYKSAEAGDDDSDGPQRVLVPTDDLGSELLPSIDERGARPPGHPLSWLQDEESASGVLDEARRKELVTLGYPDDGYDYLQHVRVVGRGKASIEGFVTDDCAVPESGPQVFIAAPEFVPPAPDVKLVDARAWTVEKSAADDKEAEAVTTRISAAEKRKKGVFGTAAVEVQQLQEDMAVVENRDNLDEQETEEWGEWLDDFVMTASTADNEQEPQRRSTSAVHTRAAGKDVRHTADFEEEGEEGGDGDYTGWSDDEDEMCSSVENDENSSPAGGQQQGSLPSRGAATAEVRPPRQPTLLDDQFEHMMGAYDDDEIGDLEDADSAHGDHDVSRYGSLLGTGSGRGAAAGHSEHGVVLRASSKVESFEVVDKAVVSATRARLEKMEMQEEEASTSAAARRTATSTLYIENPADRWDCESILSLRSNFSNQPARLVDRAVSRVKAGPSGDIIKLSSKTGLPVIPEGTKRLFPNGYAEAPADLDSRCGTTTASFSSAAFSIRSKTETPEEKRERKSLVKEVRRAARQHKKELKTVFKEESQKQQRHVAANRAVTTIVIP